MYTAPDFVKVSAKVKDVFASYCYARYGVSATDTDLENCSTYDPGNLILMAGWASYMCWVNNLE